MNGINGKQMITDTKIHRVKQLLKDWTPQTTKYKTSCSLYDIAKKTGLSYSTVWHIKAGKFDRNEKIVKKKRGNLFDVDQFKNWLTGNAV